MVWKERHRDTEERKNDVESIENKVMEKRAKKNLQKYFIWTEFFLKGT